MTQIIPALIVSDRYIYNDFEELKDKFEKLRPFLADLGGWIQIDITDGEFVSSKTNVSFDELAYFTKSAKVEFHLMVLRLKNTIEKWINLRPKRIIFHIEASEPEDIKNIIQKCKEAKIEVGLALNPETPTLTIKSWLGEVDTVMFMGVHPGRGGQELITDAATKIKLLRYNHSDIKIEIDGGVKLGNIQELKSAGVDYFVVGSGILNSPNIKKTIEEFKNEISK